MKKYTNIPLKERKRNADRVFQHEAKLEEINRKRLIKEMFEEKHRQYEQENEGKTDKDHYVDEIISEKLKKYESEGEE